MNAAGKSESATHGCLAPAVQIIALVSIPTTLAISKLEMRLSADYAQTAPMTNRPIVVATLTALKRYWKNACPRLKGFSMY